jgi:hypothetical protein
MGRFTTESIALDTVQKVLHYGNDGVEKKRVIAANQAADATSMLKWL